MIRAQIDTKKVKAYLSKIAKNIEIGTENTLRDVGELGWLFASSIVPVDKGFTREGIINFPENDETWIIMSRPPRDHPNLPINIFLDMYPDVMIRLWKNRRTHPKTGEFGFMEKTAEFLREEFKNKMNLMVEKALKG